MHELYRNAKKCNNCTKMHQCDATLTMSINWVALQGVTIQFVKMYQNWMQCIILWSQCFTFVRNPNDVYSKGLKVSRQVSWNPLCTASKGKGDLTIVKHLPLHSINKKEIKSVSTWHRMMRESWSRTESKLRRISHGGCNKNLIQYLIFSFFDISHISGCNNKKVVEQLC